MSKGVADIAEVTAPAVGGTLPQGIARARLFAVLAGLYVAQATPAFLVGSAALPIMREQGVSRTAIGMVGLLLLPMMLKFLWAPQIDRVRPFARAHRAGWIGLTQVGIIASLVALSFIQPSEVVPFMAIGIILSVLLGTQDIAVDGYATKYLAPADRPMGNAIHGGGSALGVVIGGTGSLVIYHHFGWQVAVLVTTAICLLPFALVFAMNEPAPEPAAAQASRANLRAFFRRQEARRMLVVALVYRSAEGLMAAMEGPYLVDNGVSLATIGYLSGGAAATAGLVGSAVAALLLLRFGGTVALSLLGTLRSLCYAWFALHALGLVGGFGILFGAAACHALIRYMEVVVLYSLFMATASRDQPGTDFSILACSQVMAFLVGMMSAGLLADTLGYAGLFTLAATISIVAVIVAAFKLATPKAAFGAG